jgi:hypothetical protein
MNTYKYTAKDHLSNNVVKGEIQSRDCVSAMRELRWILGPDMHIETFEWYIS